MEWLIFNWSNTTWCNFKAHKHVHEPVWLAFFSHNPLPYEHVNISFWFFQVAIFSWALRHQNCVYVSCILTWTYSCVPLLESIAICTNYKVPYFLVSWISYLCVNLSLFRFRTLSVDVMSDIFSKAARPGACLYQCWGIKTTWH